MKLPNDQLNMLVSILILHLSIAFPSSFEELNILPLEDASALLWSTIIMPPQSAALG
jgi:hypothetical protein